MDADEEEDAAQQLSGCQVLCLAQKKELCERKERDSKLTIPGLIEIVKKRFALEPSPSQIRRIL